MSDQIQRAGAAGVGRGYSVDADGDEVSIVIHHSGRRDVYLTVRTGHQPPRVATVTDDEARRLGAVLAGAYFQCYVLVLAIAGPLAASRSDLLARRLPARLFTAPVVSGKDHS